MAMTLQSSSLTRNQRAHFVELHYANDPSPEHATEVLTVRMPVQIDSPPLAEAHLEALRALRALIIREIERIEATPGRET